MSWYVETTPAAMITQWVSTVRAEHILDRQHQEQRDIGTLRQGIEARTTRRDSIGIENGSAASRQEASKHNLLRISVRSKQKRVTSNGSETREEMKRPSTGLQRLFTRYCNKQTMAVQLTAQA